MVVSRCHSGSSTAPRIRLPGAARTAGICSHLGVARYHASDTAVHPSVSEDRFSDRSPCRYTFCPTWDFAGSYGAGMVSPHKRLRASPAARGPCDLATASGATCGSHPAYSSRHSQASSGRVSAAQERRLILRAGAILSLFSPYKRGVAGSIPAAPTPKSQVSIQIWACPYGSRDRLTVI